MTINEGKELAQARKPILLGTFTFSDGTVLRVATLGCVFEGETYEARVDEQDIDRLASLSEQGVSLVPSVKIRLADPDAYLWTNYERPAGKGFRGATLQLRFALLEPNTGEFSTDSLIPFLGLCDQPSLDEKYLTVSAVSRLNLSRYSLPVMPMQLRCPAINPATAAQRIEAADPTSKFYFCGETRDLVAAPPCEYNKQTCTQLARYAGSTWQVSKEGSGREYVSGNRISWQNPDTSGKYREAWPLWLGGKAWVMGIPLAPWADGNYSRTEVAVGFGNIAIEKVVVNGVELTQGMEGDYRWHYVNQGNRDGFHNSDTGYENGDVYGNCTVIQVLAPHAVFAPGSTPEVKILGTPQDLMCFNGAAWVAGDGLAAGSLGGASTPWVLMRALWWSRVDYAEVDPQSFVAASMICDPLIQFTDKDGVIDQQPRFTSAVALRERRSASEIVRGLLQSISGILRPDATGKIKLKIEGPLAEQQPAPVDGSNYDTPVASTLRDGTPANG
ncbi:MAG: hypothetical protein LLG20_26260, partial [Acidobacteriales bacterium]|nr:hypothetical protein [Terriglobales bacterium]